MLSSDILYVMSWKVNAVKVTEKLWIVRPKMCSNDRQPFPRVFEY